MMKALSVEIMLSTFMSLNTGAIGSRQRRWAGRKSERRYSPAVQLAKIVLR